MLKVAFALVCAVGCREPGRSDGTPEGTPGEVPPGSSAESRPLIVSEPSAPVSPEPIPNLRKGAEFARSRDLMREAATTTADVVAVGDFTGCDDNRAVFRLKWKILGEVEETIRPVSLGCSRDRTVQRSFDPAVGHHLPKQHLLFLRRRNGELIRVGPITQPIQWSRLIGDLHAVEHLRAIVRLRGHSKATQVQVLEQWLESGNVLLATSALYWLNFNSMQYPPERALVKPGPEWETLVPALTNAFGNAALGAVRRHAITVVRRLGGMDATKPSFPQVVNALVDVLSSDAYEVFESAALALKIGWARIYPERPVKRLSRSDFHFTDQERRRVVRHWQSWRKRGGIKKMQQRARWIASLPERPNWDEIQRHLRLNREPFEQCWRFHEDPAQAAVTLMTDLSRSGRLSPAKHRPSALPARFQRCLLSVAQQKLRLTPTQHGWSGTPLVFRRAMSRTRKTQGDPLPNSDSSRKKR